MPSKLIIKPKQIYLPFECQPHEMVKHTQTIRRQ